MAEEVAMKITNGAMLGILMLKKAERPWRLLRIGISLMMRRTYWIGTHPQVCPCLIETCLISPSDMLTIIVDIDFGKFHELFKAAATDHAIKRGGNKQPLSEEAKIQSQRELVTLYAVYTSSQNIPFSPQEPDPNNDGSQVSEKQPVIIPLPDNIKVCCCQCNVVTC